MRDGSTLHASSLDAAACVAPSAGKMASRVTTRGSARLRKAADEVVDKENAPPPPELLEVAAKAAPIAQVEVRGSPSRECSGKNESF